MSAPGHALGGGRELRSAESSFSYRLEGLSVLGRGEERRKPQTDPGCAFLRLQALGPKESIREDRTTAPQGTPDPLPPSLRYIRRLLDHLKVRQQGHGSALAFHLANALFQTACRFDERCCCVFAMKKVGLSEIEGHRRGRRAPAFAEYPYSLPGTWLKLIA